MKHIKKMKHIILDTDIGGDADDLFALFFALGNPNICIDLLITNDEHKGHRKLFVDKFLKQNKYYVPTVQGIDNGKDKCCVVCDLVENKTRPEDKFIDIIKNTINYNNQRSIDTTYVCIGPQHNLAMFASFNPDLAKTINYLFMACLLKPRAKSEHNIRYDISAAQTVLQLPIKKTFVSSDITHNDKIRITQAHPIYQRLKNSHLHSKNLAIKSMESFFKRFFIDKNSQEIPNSLMHDPLTLSTLVDNSIVQFRDAKLIIDDKGFCHETNNGYPIRISTSANYDKFMDLFDTSLPF